MGGYGSGHRLEGQTKTAVEGCLALDMNRLRRKGRFCEPPPGGLTGRLTWKGRRAGKRLGKVDYELELLGDELALTLCYSVQGQPVELPVSIERRPQPFGGARWWFRCPRTVEGGPCLRRCGVLYLPPGGRHLGCRRCLRLTYTSCQESHQWDTAARQLAGELGLSYHQVLEQINSLGFYEKLALRLVLGRL